MEVQLAVERGPGGRRSASVAPGATLLVGRGPGVGLTLADPAVAPQHLAVHHDPARGVWVTCLGAPGGARLADAPLAPRVPTEAFGGDALALGETLLRLTTLGRGARTRARQAGAARPVDPVVPQDELEVLRTLGEGASGVVYAARWRPRGLLVAVKVLKEHVAADDPDFERFVREAGTAARLRSPHVVAVHDLRRVGPRAYVIMELVEGPSLRDLVARGPLEVPLVARAGGHVALALAAAAEAGIVHRDVKPANVVLAPDGAAKLCDFGIAKDLEATARSLTLTGVGLGTLAYMAPEQVDQARHVEPSADVYALGATLYHLLAGRPPWLPTSFQDLARILTEEPAPLAGLRPDAPPALVQAVHAMLAKDPDARPPAWRLARFFQTGA